MIDVTQIENTGKVIFGVTVKLINLDTDQSVSYQIVGEDEADAKNGKISVTSPIAIGANRKEVGEDIAVTTPGGVVEYEIDSVEHL